MRFVVDSSVAVKWLVEEDDAELARPFLDLRPEAPELLIPECTNVLWKKARKAEISFPEAARGARLLTQLNIPLWNGGDLSDRAIALAFAMDHAAYDCFYLALAERLTLPLLTADARLVRKARPHTFAEMVVLDDSAALLERLR